jgi:hypothetical protein
MQAAAAQTFRSGRETIFGDQQTGAIQEDVNLNAYRYFAQLGWNVLSVDTHAIPNAYLLRGEITPCRTYPHKANLVEIREADLIPGSEVADKDGKTVYGSYRRYAHHEAQRLVDNEATAERKRGLIEITALRSPIGDAVYRKVNLNVLFFPDWPYIPEKHEDVIKLLNDRLAALQASTPSNIPAEYLPVIYEVGEQLIEAARYAERIQKHRLTMTHSQMKLTPKDDGFKRAYDPADYEMLKRTGMPEIHSAEIQTAQALEKLTEHASGSNDGDGLKELVSVLREQNERQNQIIEMLLSERQGNGTPKPQQPQQNQKK